MKFALAQLNYNIGNFEGNVINERVMLIQKAKQEGQILESLLSLLYQVALRVIFLVRRLHPAVGMNQFIQLLRNVLALLLL